MRNSEQRTVNNMHTDTVFEPDSPLSGLDVACRAADRIREDRLRREATFGPETPHQCYICASFHEDTHDLTKCPGCGRYVCGLCIDGVCRECRNSERN